MKEDEELREQVKELVEDIRLQAMEEMKNEFDPNTQRFLLHLMTLIRVIYEEEQTYSYLLEELKAITNFLSGNIKRDPQLILNVIGEIAINNGT